DEFLALAYWKEKKLPTVVVRLFNTVGPRQTGQYGMVIPTFVRQALQGHAITVYGDGSQSRCFCHVADVVRGLADLMDSPAAVREVWNIGSTEEVTILELARRVRHLAGTGVDITYVPYEKAYEEGFEDMVRRIPDTGKVRQAIGWQPTLDLDRILKDVFDF